MLAQSRHLRLTFAFAFTTRPDLPPFLAISKRYNQAAIQLAEDPSNAPNIKIASRGRDASRPGEFHPEALTEPCVTVSRHTARAILKRAAALRRNLRAPPVSSWPCGPGGMACPLRSTDIAPCHHYYEVVRPSISHPYFRPRGSSHL